MKKILLTILFVVISCTFLITTSLAIERPAQPDEPEQPNPPIITIVPPSKPEFPPLAKVEFIHFPRTRSRPRPTPTPTNSPRPSATAVPSVAPTPSASCPNPDYCNEYSASRYRWADPNGMDDTGLPYFINSTNSSSIDISSFAHVIASSFATWENANTSRVLRYTQVGTTGSSAGVQDFQNVVSFKNFTANYSRALAITTVWYRVDNGQIVEFDIAINNQMPWKINNWPDGCSEYPVNICGGDGAFYDLENVVTHEAGHTLMLLDLYQTKQREMTMYGYAQKGELKKRTLGKGDLTGVNTLYPYFLK